MAEIKQGGEAEFLKKELSTVTRELVQFYDRHVARHGTDAARLEMQRIIGLPGTPCKECKVEYYQMYTDMVCNDCFWKELGL